MKIEIELPDGSEGLYLFYRLKQGNNFGVIAYPIVQDDVDKKDLILVRKCCTAILNTENSGTENTKLKVLELPYNEHSTDTSLQLERVLHRIIRGMNDGECPNCHILDRTKVVTLEDKSLICQVCCFRISKNVIDRAMELWTPIAEKNLEKFMRWLGDYND